MLLYSSFQYSYCGNNTLNVKKSTAASEKGTMAEETLWDRLRNTKFKNLKFRRQHPIGRYVERPVCCRQGFG
ncbi:MAG: DUF559 domain-containing protein [Ignavibacteria bacterium]